jgi:hypothetical protein
VDDLSDVTPTDLIVRTGNPTLLHQTVQRLPGVVAAVVEGSWDDEQRTCRLRVFSGIGFVKFAVTNQGYGTVLAEEEVDRG